MKTSKTQVTYCMEIKLRDNPEIVREIEIVPRCTLYNLARQITKAFNFYFDHCFGYYDVITAQGSLDKAKKRYELFADIDREEGIIPENPGVKRVSLTTLWKQPGDTWNFLFDYGDTRIFIVTLKKRGVKSDIRYPRLLSQQGRAPEQYPMAPEDLEYEEAMKADLEYKGQCEPEAVEETNVH